MWLKSMNPSVLQIVTIKHRQDSSICIWLTQSQVLHLELKAFILSVQLFPWHCYQNLSTISTFYGLYCFLDSVSGNFPGDEMGSQLVWQDGDDDHCQQVNKADSVTDSFVVIWAMKITNIAASRNDWGSSVLRSLSNYRHFKMILRWTLGHDCHNKFQVWSRTIKFWGDIASCPLWRARCEIHTCVVWEWFGLSTSFD